MTRLGGDGGGGGDVGGGCMGVALIFWWGRGEREGGINCVSRDAILFVQSSVCLLIFCACVLIDSHLNGLI